jgi:hypothetical protein
MSESSGTAPGGSAAGSTPASGTTAAQDAFGKYKARLAGPMMMPATPGWAMPPSMAAMPPLYPPGYPYASQGPERPHPLGSLTERLGATLRLGVDLLNAALASGAHALGGGMAGYGPWGGHGCECGCADPCGYDCCGVMGKECCRPGAHGCGCGCC